MATIHVNENEKNLTITISIRNRFDFGAHKEFRSCYKDRTSGFRYVINMRDVNYIDSSALGMLLLLREHAMANKGKVVIENCSPEIRKLLTIANFERLFDIQ